MFESYLNLQEALRTKPMRWAVTGVAGFIGSNLLQALLSLDQTVIGLDNFATGHQRNLDEVRSAVDERQWARFHFVSGDIRNLQTCNEICHGSEIILHQAALGSVPRSIEDPIRTHETNLSGFLNMLVASRDAKVERFIYAASSSTYGDEPHLPKVEDRIGRPLSPYAVTKYVNELYADVFSKTYALPSIGLRYFNVFGPRQDPAGAYAAVIPKWIAAMLADEQVCINGDGETSRDFCFVGNVVQANLLAATTTNPQAMNQVYNVALGDRTSLKELFELIRDTLSSLGYGHANPPLFAAFRPGDIRHSQADIGKAMRLLNYAPQTPIKKGIGESMPWYIASLTHRL